MKRTILCGIVAAALAPAIALAGPKWDPRSSTPEVSMDRKGAEIFTCNAGAPESLFAAAAVVGLLRRRRH